jgi:S1-C subfamily serine protease
MTGRGESLNNTVQHLDWESLISKARLKLPQGAFSFAFTGLLKLNDMPKLTRKQLTLLASGLLVIVIISALVGAVVGASFPSLLARIPLLAGLSSEAGLREVTQGGERVVRTVEESAVIDVVDNSAPAVVSIVAKTVSLDPNQGVQQVSQGIGTGFIVRNDGIILTNAHVVEDQSISYTVVTKDKKTFPVQKIDRDPSIDFAILKIDASDLPTLDLGDSDSLKVGQKVVAIGNALGRFDNTVTVGVVSGVGRGVTTSNQFGVSAETLENVIQTDAALNPGNSGGPLLDLSSNVIGINFATSIGAENLGFVIPINRIKSILEQYYANGRIIRPYLGISYVLIDADTAAIQDLPQGVFVRRVVAGSPAEKAGVAAGDVITKIGDVELKDGTTLVSAISRFKVGDKVDLTVSRDRKTVVLKSTLGEAPS